MHPRSWAEDRQPARPPHHLKAPGVARSWPRAGSGAGRRGARSRPLASSLPDTLGRASFPLQLCLGAWSPRHVHRPFNSFRLGPLALPPNSPTQVGGRTLLELKGCPAPADPVLRVCKASQHPAMGTQGRWGQTLLRTGQARDPAPGQEVAGATKAIFAWEGLTGTGVFCRHVSLTPSGSTRGPGRPHSLLPSAFPAPSLETRTSPVTRPRPRALRHLPP